MCVLFLKTVIMKVATLNSLVILKSTTLEKLFFMKRYICSNDTKLPGAFDACQNKEQLWTAVGKGLRPEKLPRFDPDCWELMVTCWDGDTQNRPLVGDIALRIQLIMKRIGRKALF